MPRKSKGTGRRRGGGGARGGKRNGNQKKTTTGFSIRRNGGPLNLSEWSNSSSSSVGSRRGADSTKKASPTKRKRGTVHVPRPYAKALPQNADIEFQPSVLEFKPFVAADDPAAAVAELQSSNLKAFEDQFGASDKADRKRMRDLNRKAVAAKRRAETQALTAGNIFAALDGSDDEEDAGGVARPADSEFSESANRDSSAGRDADSPWASLFVESSATLTFQPPKQSAAEAAAAAAAAEAEKAEAQAAEAAELGVSAVATDSTVQESSTAPPSTAAAGSSSVGSSKILDSVRGHPSSVEVQTGADAHDEPEVVRDEEEEEEAQDEVADILEDEGQANPLLTKIESRWPMIAVGGEEYSVGSNKSDAAAPESS